MSSPAASVIIRSKNEERDIGRVLSALASQTIGSELETIVVDSGSRDATLDLVREFGIEPIEIPASSFTYGGALNLGCGIAQAEILIALSAHAVPMTSDWIERIIEPFANPRLACACGYEKGPDGMPLTAPVLQDAALAARMPGWGYSSAAGAFRAELWRQRPFREDLPGSEDKEWAWYWLCRGWVALVDPRLAVEHDHRDEGLRLSYRRARREAEGLGMFVPREQSGLETARRWWSDLDGRSSHLRARLSPTRIAQLLGRWLGDRAAHREMTR